MKHQHVYLSTLDRPVKELKELRTANTKVFMNDLGEKRACIYPGPVHYKADGAFEEIDDRFGDADAAGDIGNRKGRMKVKLANKAKKEGLVGVNSGKYKWSWGPVNAYKTDRKIIHKEGGQEASHGAMDLTGLISDTALYADVWPDTDLSYRIISEDIKEDIILKKAPIGPVSFSFAYKIQGSEKLTGTLRENGDITFTDDGGMVAFKISAPFMTDAAGAFSEDVHLELKAEKSGKDYIITVMPELSWLSDPERVYPVTIDPIVVTSTDIHDIYDVRLSSKYPSSNYRDETLIKTGYASGEVSRTLLKFTLPDLASSEVVTRAVFRLRNYTAASGTRRVNVHRVTADWDRNTVCWNTKPAVDWHTEDFLSFAPSAQADRYFDITSMVKQWYLDGENFGLMIKDNEETGNLTSYCSSDYDTEGYRPLIVISYISNRGLEDYWTYHSQEVGRAGTGYVQDYSGTMLFIHDTLSLPGNRMPLDIKHVFNLCVRNNPLGYGLGWRLSVHQQLYAVDIGGISYYVHIDGDGTKHYYKESEGHWKNELDPDLELTISTSDPDAPYVITDKKGGKLVFGSNTWLVKIKDANGNAMDIAYTGNRVASVTDASGRRADFYYTNGLLDKITDPSGREKLFSYTSGRLTGITDFDGEQIIFAYDASKGRFTLAEDPSGYQMKYVYNSHEPYHVTRIEEKHVVRDSQGEITSETAGGKLMMAYGFNKTVFTDHKGRKTTYLFNNAGHTVSVHDDMGRGQMAKRVTEGNLVNKLTALSDVQCVTNQLIREVVPAAGTTIWQANDTAKCTVDTNAANSHNGEGRSLKLSPTTLTEQLVWSQSVPVVRGKTYTLSVYVKKDLNPEEEHAVFLGVNSEGHRRATVYADASSDWQRLMVTFTAQEGEGASVNASCFIAVKGGIGNVWAADMQLEEAPAAGHVSLITNSSFDRGLLGFSRINAEANDGVKTCGTASKYTRPLMGVVTHDGAPLRVGAGTEYNLVDTADLDAELYVYGADYDKNNAKWYYVRTAIDGSFVYGYMIGNYMQLAPLGTSVSVKGVTAKNSFVIRQTAGSSGTVVATLPMGVALTITGAGKSGNDKWYKVKATYEGTTYTGYSYCGHLAVYSPIEQTGTTNAATNLMWGPDSSYSIRAALPVSTPVTVIGRTIHPDFTVWRYIKVTVDGSELLGYVPSSSLTLTGMGTHPDLVTIYSETVPQGPMGEKVYMMQGSRTQVKRLYQTIDIAGNAGDTFVAAGWGYGASVPKSDTDSARYFGIFVNFFYADGTNVYRYADFGADAEDWQYVSEAFVAERAYTKVRAGFVYSHNANTAYFDGLALYKEQFGSSYTYDSNRNVISAKDKAKQETSFTYNGSNDLTRLTDPKGRNFTYTYDSHHNVTGAQSAAGVKYIFTYDGYGNPTTGKVQDIGDSSKKILASAAYETDNSIKGQYMKSLTDPFGKVTSFVHQSPGGDLTSVKDALNHQTSYTYDSVKRLTRAQQGSMRTAYSYADDRLSGLSHGDDNNNTNYTFTYDGFGRCTQVKAGTRTLVTQTWAANNGPLTKAKYGNNWETVYTRDGEDRVIKLTAKNGSSQTDLCEYVYNPQGELAQVTDKTNTSKTVTYDYDLLGRLRAAHYKDGTGYRYLYDANDCLTKEIQTLPDGVRIINRTYDADDRETKSQASGILVQKAYDGLGRLSTQTYRETEVAYEYWNGANGSTSNRIKKVTGIGKTWEYTYDDLGNVLTEKNGGKTRKFTYDAYSRLIRVDDQEANVTTTYAYNTGGNMTARKTYAYTTGTLPATPVTSISYGYDTDWKDLLTQIGSAAVTSDGSGNILTDGTHTYTWTRGSLLASMTKSGQTATYTYDAGGMRTRKVSGGVTTDYTYAGNLLMAEKKGDACQRYFYDASGILCAISYNGHTYYFIRDGLMNITDIINVGGTSVVHYTYDAWGKILSVTGSMANTLGHDNPFRYKGYYYDEESGLYYLISRYYDPIIGRFVSTDNSVGGFGNLYDNNLFLYCSDNPINRMDPFGHFWKEVREWVSNTCKDICKAVNKIVHTAKAVSYGLYYTATKWHFEDRIAKNGLHPSYQDVVTPKSEWRLLKKSESVFHDNGIGEPEMKFIKDDGREAVFDGDTYQPVKDPRYMATYNYVSPYVIPSSNASITDYALAATTRLGHFVFDVLPYFLTLGSNTREQFEAHFNRIIIW